MAGLARGSARPERKDPLDLLAQGSLHLGEVVKLPPGEAVADRFEEVRCGVHSDVGGEEDLLQLRERSIVERLARAEERVEPGDESAACLRQAFGEGPSRLRLGELRPLRFLYCAGSRFFRRLGLAGYLLASRAPKSSRSTSSSATRQAASTPRPG